MGSPLSTISALFTDHASNRTLLYPLLQHTSSLHSNFHPQYHPIDRWHSSQSSSRRLDSIFLRMISLPHSSRNVYRVHCNGAPLLVASFLHSLPQTVARSSETNLSHPAVRWRWCVSQSVGSLCVVRIRKVRAGGSRTLCITILCSHDAR